MKQINKYIIEKLIINKDTDFNPHRHRNPMSAMIDEFAGWLEEEYNLSQSDKNSFITKICKLMDLDKDSFDLIDYNNRVQKHLKNKVIDKYIETFNPKSNDKFNDKLVKVFENTACKIYFNNIDPGERSIRYWMLFITNESNYIEYSYFIDIFL